MSRVRAWLAGLAELAGRGGVRIRPSVRLRLAFLSGGLVVLAGALVLGMTYFFQTGPFYWVERTLAGGLAGRSFFIQVGGSAPLLPRAVQQALAGLHAAALPAAPVPSPSALYAVATQVSAAQRAADLQTLLTRGGIAVAILAALAVGAGWWIAGRLLRPLHVMTERVRDLSARTPLGRIALAGPADELKDLADTFDELLARLDAALAADRRFVANASHELRTPLAIQQTLLDVGLADPGADVASLRDMGERLRQVNERSKRLIEGLLTLASSQQGLRRTEAADLAEAADAALAAIACDPGALAVRVEQDLQPAPIRGDPVLLERLAGNLLENAVRYNCPGGWVRVRTGTERGAAVLTVDNSGPPVDAAQVAGLFEPFRRGARDRTDSHRGAGLGLSIVRAVVEAHAGTVAAQARPDGGLAVRVAIPAVPAPLTSLAVR